MANTREIEVMRKMSPAGITELSTAVSRGEGQFVNVMGVVHDFMPPSHTRGTDMQMTFILKDKSLLPNGLRFKFFRKSPDQFPKIQHIGDVVLLRDVKIRKFNNEMLGVSSHGTEHVVFPNHAVPSLEHRMPSGAHVTFLQNTKSSDAPQASLHEQQWAVVLKDYFQISNEPPPASEPRSNVRTANSSCSPNPQSLSTITSAGAGRDKSALIKSIAADGFYDLAGEAVKMFFSSFGYLDLYLCDYTVNRELHDYGVGSLDADPGNKWRGPAGQMSLHIELHQPHASWTQTNIKEGDLILLKNVRIKNSQNPKNGKTILEGNLWQDKFYPDKVCVVHLATSDPRHAEILSRKKSYQVNVVNNAKSEILTNSKSSKKRKKQAKKREEAKRQRQDEYNARVRSLNSSFRTSDAEGEGSDAEGEDENDSANESSNGATNDMAEDINRDQSKKKKLNPNIRCQYPDVPLSSMTEILCSTKDQFIKLSSSLTIQERKQIQIPFNNVKHRACLRVADFYPHDLKDFAIGIPRPEGISSSQPKMWKWQFWLTVTSAHSSLYKSNFMRGESDKTPEFFNLLVEGKDAEILLGHSASKSNHRALEKLNETLFLLWGELAEKKDKFLHSHPNIKPDHSFCASDYNICTSKDEQALPFEACIAEYGIPDPTFEDYKRSDEKVFNKEGKSESESRNGVGNGTFGTLGWIRLFRLFGTSIE